MATHYTCALRIFFILRPFPASLLFVQEQLFSSAPALPAF